MKQKIRLEGDFFVTLSLWAKFRSADMTLCLLLHIKVSCCLLLNKILDRSINWSERKKCACVSVCVVCQCVCELCVNVCVCACVFVLYFIEYNYIVSQFGKKRHKSV